MSEDTGPTTHESISDLSLGMDTLSPEVVHTKVAALEESARKLLAVRSQLLHTGSAACMFGCAFEKL